MKKTYGETSDKKSHPAGASSPNSPDYFSFLQGLYFLNLVGCYHISALINLFFRARKKFFFGTVKMFAKLTGCVVFFPLPKKNKAMYDQKPDLLGELPETLSVSYLF